MRDYNKRITKYPLKGEDNATSEKLCDSLSVNA